MDGAQHIYIYISGRVAAQECTSIDTRIFNYRKTNRKTDCCKRVHVHYEFPKRDITRVFDIKNENYLLCAINHHHHRAQLMV